MLFCLCSYRRGALIVESRFEREKRAKKKEANSYTDFLRVRKSSMTKLMTFICRHDGKLSFQFSDVFFVQFIAPRHRHILSRCINTL